MSARAVSIPVEPSSQEETEAPEIHTLTKPHPRITALLTPQPAALNQKINRICEDPDLPPATTMNAAQSQ